MCMHLYVYVSVYIDRKHTCIYIYRYLYTQTQIHCIGVDTAMLNTIQKFKTLASMAGLEGHLLQILRGFTDFLEHYSGS